jgi:hypothetical protein
MLTVCALILYKLVQPLCRRCGAYLYTLRMQCIEQDLQRCKALLSVDNRKLWQITNVRCARL